MSVIPSGFGSGSEYSIANSVRLTSGSTQFFYRTPGSAPTNSKIATLSFLYKRTRVGSRDQIISHNVPTNCGLYAHISTDDQLYVSVSVNGTGYGCLTNMVFRDPSAWYHIMIVVDTTQGTAANRTKVYVNGVQQSFASSAYPNQNDDPKLNSNTAVMRIGVYDNGTLFPIDGHLSDFYLIDGQALTPSSFGKTDAYGVWVPIKYAGTYGTNGCKLAFGSSGALGTDTSGNGNNWTVSGSPVQTVDTPTNNYCTLNPLDYVADGSTISNGNLTISNSTSGYARVRGTIGLSSGKWYFRCKVGSVNSAFPFCGIQNSVTPLPTGVTLGNGTDNWCIKANGYAIYNGVDTSTGLGSYAANDYMDVAVDVGAGKVWFGKNGVWSGNPDAGTGAMYSGLTGTLFPVLGETYPSTSITADFQTSAPANATTFKTICTANLQSVAVTTSGTFTGNANADGPFVWTNGSPTTLTINGNAVTFGTHADKTAGGFKLKTASVSYNTSGSNTWTATAGKRFVYSATSINNAQGNP